MKVRVGEIEDYSKTGVMVEDIKGTMGGEQKSVEWEACSRI